MTNLMISSNDFFLLLKDKELEIIDSTSILNKCVIVEDENIFNTSVSLNLSHYSLKKQF